MVLAVLKHMHRVDYMFCHQVGVEKGFCLDDKLILSVSREQQMS